MIAGGCPQPVPVSLVIIRWPGSILFRRGLIPGLRLQGRGETRDDIEQLFADRALALAIEGEAQAFQYFRDVTVGTNHRGQAARDRDKFVRSSFNAIEASVADAARKLELETNLRQFLQQD